MENCWNGFKCEWFEFEGKKAVIVFPHEAESERNWLLKTEYWDGYPQTEIEMLKRGFHLAYVQNETRFATVSDCERKARFVKFISEEYGLRDKCTTVGYSCGGAHAVNFAGYFPECVCCLFIDAPVLNFCDYPGRLSDEKCEKVWENEFVLAYPGITRAKLLNFQNHPINRVDVLKRNKLPIIMLYGSEDETVYYDLNGRLLEQEYEDCPELLTVIERHLQGHHPHGFLLNTKRGSIYDERVFDLIVEKTRKGDE